jgi:hypothetical protein
MDRFLAMPSDRRAIAFAKAGAASGWPTASVEKDFWVCLLLREVFGLPAYGQHIIFKGGTSLSKAWHLIDRFSEDVDLSIDREALGFGGERAPEAAVTGKERKRRLKALAIACRNAIYQEIAPALRNRLAVLLPSRDSWSLDPDADDPDDQSLLFAYPRTEDPRAIGYLRPVVKLEFGSRSDPWPNDCCQIVPIVAQQLPLLFDSPAGTVRALRPERTFWEKAMLVHEERFRPVDRPRRARLARHYYDLWRLILSGVGVRAAADEDLFVRVAKHRELYFAQTWVDYRTLQRGSLQMLPLERQAAEWRADYQAMRAAMFVDEPPPFEDLLRVVERFQDDFNRG